MKPKALVAPVMALVVGCIWLAFQGRSVSALAAENAKLRERVEAAGAAKSGGESRGRDEGGDWGGKVVKAGGAPRKILADQWLPLDWKAIGARLVELEKGTTSNLDDRFTERLEKRLEGMSRDELVAALGEIGESGMALSSRKAILEKMLDPMMEKDPAWTLSRYVSEGLVDTDRLAGVFNQWATEDLPKGIEWLDGQIAAGNFDGRSPEELGDLRLAFEGKLMEPLFSKDPELALARLEALPESQRAEVMRNPRIEQIPESEQKEFVALKRKYLTTEEMEQEVASYLHFASQEPDSWIKKNLYARTTEYLERFSALPDERLKTATEMAGYHLDQIRSAAPDPKFLDELRSWIETQAPGMSAAITGAKMADVINDEFTFEQAAAVVVEYDRGTEKQEGLIHFLKQLASPELQEKAIPLVNRITDEAVRREILKDYQPEDEEE